MIDNLMINELLKIIFSADKLLSEHSIPDQEKNMQLIVSCFQELEEIDGKIRQHFQEVIEK
jgi:hypothetical protein